MANTLARTKKYTKKNIEKAVFRIRIRIQSGHWIRIQIRIWDVDPDPGGQK
jgi:hypothetical protein